MPCSPAEYKLQQAIAANKIKPHATVETRRLYARALIFSSLPKQKSVW